MLRTLAVLATVITAQSSILLYAADCAALKSLPLQNTTITLAEPVTSGTLALPDIAPLEKLPAFCRVAGVLRPTSDSAIHFEVWLPNQDWNGRLLGTGNGGFAGSISWRQMSGCLMRGFAVSGSDAGHRAEAGDASWAFGHPEKVKDFGWRAIHLTADVAKQIIRAYYGKPQSKAYFDACSDGGREALMEAQRFPEDYDGILAGAPANYWSHLLGAAIAATQALTSDPRSYISDLKLPAIQKASLAACDALDGVKDGIIGDPSQCHFDPSVLLCKDEDSPDCLTQPQIEALKSLYAGAKDHNGATLFPGLTMGDETGWGVWVVGEGPGASAAALYAQNDFRYIVTGDPKWNALTADLSPPPWNNPRRRPPPTSTRMIPTSAASLRAAASSSSITAGTTPPSRPGTPSLTIRASNKRWAPKKLTPSLASIWLPARSTAPADPAPAPSDSSASPPPKVQSSGSSMHSKIGLRKTLLPQTSWQPSTRPRKTAPEKPS